MSNTKYAIYLADIEKGGKYNLLAYLCKSLYRGFSAQGLNVFSYRECIENNINFDVAIGFDGYMENWNNVINSNKINIFWSFNSLFDNNILPFKNYVSKDNFFTFISASDDIEAVKTYLPELKFMYLTHATDETVFEYKKEEKTNDIVFFSSITDAEEKLEKFKNSQKDDFLYKLVLEVIDIVSKKPNSTFFEIYNLIKNSCDINLDISEYCGLFKLVTEIVEHRRKIKLVKALSKLNIKIFGNSIWEKYITGNAQYKGEIDINNTNDIINKSKIVLHIQSPQMICGLHAGILNTSCAGSFCLTNTSPFVQNEFGENFGYYNCVNFDDAEQTAQYYLSHEQEREQKAQEARAIVLERHLFKHRAKQIDELFT